MAAPRSVPSEGTWIPAASGSLSVVEGGSTAMTILGADSLTVEGCRLRSASAAAAGASSIGLRVDHARGIRIANNRIY